MIVGGTGVEARNQKFYLGFIAFEMPGRSPVNGRYPLGRQMNMQI